MDIFNRKWCIVTMKDGRKERLYVVDVEIMKHLVMI